MPQSLAQVWLHIVFSSKGRRPFLQNDCSSAFHWQSGYGVFSVSHSNRNAVDAYIRNQPEHHQKLSFQDEYRELCKRHEIEIDERYVWD